MDEVLCCRSIRREQLSTKARAEASDLEQPDEGGSTDGSEHFANLTWNDFTDILWLGMSYE